MDSVSFSSLIFLKKSCLPILIWSFYVFFISSQLASTCMHESLMVLPANLSLSLCLHPIYTHWVLTTQTTPTTTNKNNLKIFTTTLLQPSTQLVLPTEADLTRHLKGRTESPGWQKLAASPRGQKWPYKFSSGCFCYFRDKCVVFARNCKFAKLTQ